MATQSATSIAPTSPTLRSPPASKAYERTPAADIQVNGYTDCHILADLGLLTAARHLNPDDLKLLANWCTTTYRSFPHDGENERIWRVAVPQDSLRHSALLEGILALSALQLASQNRPASPEQSDLQQAAHTHWTKAHPGLEGEACHSRKSPNYVRFALRSILVVFAFANVQLLRLSSQTSALDGFCLLFRELRLSKQAVIDSVDIFREEDMAALATEREVDPVMPNTSALTIYALRNLNARCDKPGSEGQEMQDIYSQSIDQLALGLSYTAWGSNPGLVGLSWILGIPAGYMDLVAERQPMGLTILAHYCVVLYHLRKHWWMGDFGIQVLEEICSLLGRDRLSTITWAIDTTGICLPDDLV